MGAPLFSMSSSLCDIHHELLSCALSYCYAYLPFIILPMEVRGQCECSSSQGSYQNYQNLAVSNQLLDVGRGGGAKVKYGVRSPKLIWAPIAQLYSLAENLKPLPPHMGSFTRALLVNQDRRHFFVALWERAECFGVTVDLLMCERGGTQYSVHATG
jgi:hypothetical protein